MTQSGNSVPPGAPEPKQSVVKRYLPKRRSAIVPMASDCCVASFSTMASPPQARSGVRKMSTPDAKNGMMRRVA